MTWDFSKLPESEYDRVALAVETANERELIRIHDEYKLSDFSYCCGQSGVYQWFLQFIQENEKNRRTAESKAKEMAK